MANTIGAGSSSKGTRKMTETITQSNAKVTPEVKQKKLGLNDSVKAKEYFSLKEKFILGPTELSLVYKEQPDIINIIDVRQPADYAKGHLPGAINLPREQWQTAVGLKKDKLNVIYCYNLECPLASKAASEFAAKGYSVMELVGGFSEWEESNYKTEIQVHH